MDNKDHIKVINQIQNPDDIKEFEKLINSQIQIIQNKPRGKDDPNLPKCNEGHILRRITLVHDEEACKVCGDDKMSKQPYFFACEIPGCPGDMCLSCFRKKYSPDIEKKLSNEIRVLGRDTETKEYRYWIVDHPPGLCRRFHELVYCEGYLP